MYMRTCLCVRERVSVRARVCVCVRACVRVWEGVMTLVNSEYLKLYHPIDFLPPWCYFWDNYFTKSIIGWKWAELELGDNASGTRRNLCSKRSNCSPTTMGSDHPPKDDVF